VVNLNLPEVSSNTIKVSIYELLKHSDATSIAVYSFLFTQRLPEIESLLLWKSFKLKIMNGLQG
jgi:hypothetical protein